MTKTVPRATKRAPKPRNYGEGSLYFDKSKNVWRGAFIVRDEFDRPRRIRVSHRDQTEALARLKLEIALYERGAKPVGQEDMLVGTYLEQWLDEKRETLRRSGIHTYETAVRVHLRPKLEHLRLRDLNRTHVLALLKAMKDDGRGERTIEVVIKTLRTALKAAMALGDLGVTRNVAEQVKIPTVQKAEMRFWTAEQALSFLDVVRADSPALYPLFAMALGTGMRQGELFGLRRDAVDLEAAKVRVVGQLDPKTYDYVAYTKTSGSRRVVDLPASACAALRERKVARISPYVLCDEEGQPLRFWRVRRLFNALIAKAGVPLIRFHDLRHTAAVLMRIAAVDWLVISRRLGHSDPGFTMRVYGHIVDEMGAQAASAIEDRFFGRLTHIAPLIAPPSAL